MRGRCLGLVACALVLAVPAVGCGDDDDDGGGGAFGGGDAGDLASVSGALASLPDNGEDQTIVWGDLARAAEIAGLERPTDLADADAVQDYLMAVTGTVRSDDDTGEPVAIVPPDAAQVDRSVEIQGFADDVGWNILQVDRFAERQTRPDQITLLDGEFDDAALTTAMGDPTDGVWVAGSGGEAGELNVDEITPARPLGESLWLSRNGGDGVLSVTHSAEAAATADAAAAGNPKGAVLGDDASLAALAGALDEQDAYGALVLRPGINGLGAVGAVTPEQAEQLCGELLPEPTAALATGITSDDEGPVVLIALAQLTSDAAGANADALETMVGEGASVVSGQPWSERFTLDGVETTGPDDLVVVARLRPVDAIGARLWYDVVMQRDSLVTSC
jgi:hypothetical protein